jgi:hypothetical protein
MMAMRSSAPANSQGWEGLNDEMDEGRNPDAPETERLIGIEVDTGLYRLRYEV